MNGSISAPSIPTSGVKSTQNMKINENGLSGQQSAANLGRNQGSLAELNTGYQMNEDKDFFDRVGGGGSSTTLEREQNIGNTKSGFNFDMLKLSTKGQELELNATLVENRIAKMDSDQRKILLKIERTREQAQKILEKRQEKEEKLKNRKIKEMEDQKKLEELQVKNLRDRQDRERMMGVHKEIKHNQMNTIGDQVRKEREMFTKLKYKIIESEV